jgi:chaperone modulatory protein CbpM
METELLIALDEFCKVHNIELSFIYSLQDSGLIEIVKIRDSNYIEADRLHQLEKFVRLYYDLDINLEGIETINYLLDRISSMQEEIKHLKNKLRMYEI